MKKDFIDDEIDLKKIILFFKRYFKLYALLATSFFILGLFTYQFIPKYYLSKISFIEKKQNNNYQSPLSIFSTSNSSAINNLKILLKSRLYQKKIEDKFLKFKEENRLSLNISDLNLSKNLDLIKSKDNLITISYKSKKKKEAYLIVKLCFSQLLNVYNSLNFSTNKEFLIIIDKAEIPNSHYSPKLINFLGIFTIIGLITALILSLLLEFNKKKIY